MKLQRAVDGDRTLAVFIDFENLALGFGGRRDRFQIHKVLERLVEKGKIVAKKAYADWSRFGPYAGSLHEAAIELIEIPKRSMTGKNSADIRLVVDAIDLAYSKDHIDTFCIVSGDSDFSPLVSKLKELGKHVIGLGLVDATSNLLRDNCDEFIYYEDLDRHVPITVGDNTALPDDKRKVFGLLLDSLVALRRENKELIFSSMAKDTMKRKRPSFNEEYHGYRTFSDLLEDAARFGLVEIEKHKGSGTYVVLRFGGEIRTPPLGGGPQLPHPQPMALPAAGRPPRDARDRTEERGAPDRAPAQTGRTPVPPPQQSPTRVPQSRQPAPLPQRPAAQPAAALRPPVQPSSPRPAAPVEDETPGLGRSLIAEIDDEDDLDEVPSYSRTKKPHATPAKPVRAATTKPASTAKPAVKPAAKPKGTATAKPAAKASAAKPAAAETPAKAVGGRTAAPKAPAKPKPVAEAALPPRQSAAPKPVPKPKAPAAEDDGFGAGLDE